MGRLLLVALLLAPVLACSDSPPTPTVARPAIDSVTPAWGSHGAEVRIFGRQFATDTLRVYFGTHLATHVQPPTSTRAVVLAPSGLAAGLHDVRLQNRGGGADTAARAFELILPPVLDSVSPARGTVGTEVGIHGSAFAAESVTVYFGALQASAVHHEAGALFATAPEGLVRDATYDVRVVNRERGADTLFNAFRAVAPSLLRVNGVTKPTGLVGMLVYLEGHAFGDAGHGGVFFRASDGTRIRAVIADSTNDWADQFVVTTVPQGTADVSMIWIETATGTDSIEFNLIQNGVFSPSTIRWTATSPLPQPLQGMGAVFVPIEEGLAPANYVYMAGGADSAMRSTRSVYRTRVQQSGALDTWAVSSHQLPAPRAYHATVGATAYTAAIDSTMAGYLYVLGGQDSTGTTVSTVFVSRVELDGSLAGWQSTTPLPQPIHGASAVVFRGFVYLAGGADATGAARTQVYRAPVREDGTLGGWDPITSLDTPRSHFSLVSFGPYLYAIGGESGTTSAVTNAQTGTEAAAVSLARINLRTGAIGSGGWSAVNAMGKVRSKHSAVFAGGALFVTSGLYPGIGVSGSSENTYATINADGTLGSWQGATNAQTINSAIGYSLYNQAMVTFIDNAGVGHIVVIGGANTSQAGKASDKVIFY